MGMVAGTGGHPQDAVGLIDTRIYGNPEEIREAAAVIEKLHNTFHDAFIEMMNSLVPMPEYWAGKSADAYEEALFDFRLKPKTTPISHTDHGKQCAHTRNSSTTTTATWRQFAMMLEHAD